MLLKKTKPNIFKRFFVVFFSAKIAKQKNINNIKSAFSYKALLKQ